MSGNFEQAKSLFLQGLDHYQAGRFEDARSSLAASLALLPGRASTLTNLGATLLKLGRPLEALGFLSDALTQEPGNLEAGSHQATALAELGRHAEAMASIERVLAIDPGNGAAWSLRGSLQKDLGQTALAALSFEKAIACGADALLNGYYLAGVRGGETPDAPPRRYVENLFDGYAGSFDHHLVQVLRYSAPQVLATGLLAMHRRFASALDLGCGTGLCGPAVKAMVDRLEGVDLSANMLAQALELKLYDELVQADVTDHLAMTERRYDLVLAADVFIYVGALEPVFASVARALDAGGVFCFSVEEASAGEDLALQPSLRYVHSERSIRALAAQWGFDVADCARHTIREDQRVPIPGLFAWLVKR